ncbi:MAG TPA: hypothetical protein VGI73_10225 [Solirubrobacterales bacterium]
MTVLTEKTSRAGLEFQLWRHEVADLDQTGWELGHTYQVIAIASAAQVIREKVRGLRLIEPLITDELSAQAAALAREQPQVASVALPPPRLSGNLAEDVHDVCGLTWDQIAGVFGVSERAAAGWRAQGVPRHRQEVMEALRAIGVLLVAGLGPEGVARWLTAGDPSRLERLRDGEVEAIAAEARSYLDAPAT